MKSVVIVLTVLVAPVGARAADDAAAEADVRLARILQARTGVSPSPSEAPTSADPLSTQTAWRWAYVTTGIAGVLLAAAYVARRRKEVGWLGDNSTDLMVKDSVWVGKGQRLLLVKVGQQSFLLSSTSTGIEALAELGGDERSIPKDPPSPSPEPSFRDLVSSAMTSDAKVRTKRKQIMDGLRAL